MILERPRKKETIALILSGSLFLLALLAPPLFASTLTLAWDDNTEADLGGYSLYYGTRSGDYDSIIDVGNVTQYAVTGLAPHTRYYFALKAYDFYGNESDFSAELSEVSPADPSPTPILGGGGGGGGGCFIATAAYGSYLHPHVGVLRGFRDEFLISTALGRKCVHLYHQFAPRIANHMEKYGFLRILSRLALLPLIGMTSLSLNVAISPTFLFLPLCLVLIVATTLPIHTRQTR